MNKLLSDKAFTHDQILSFIQRKKKKLRSSQLRRLTPSGLHIPTLDKFLSRYFLKKLLKNTLKDPLYTPKTYRVRPLQQENKLRLIYHLDFYDYLICKGLSFFIETRLESLWPDSLYSFRKSFSSKRCIEELRQTIKSSPENVFYFLKTDFSEFDTRIRHENVTELLKPHVPQNTTNLLLKFLRGTASYKGAEFCLVEGLPTGTPLVPVLENLYLLPLDEIIRSKKPLFYGRYGDDLILLDQNPDLILEIENLIKDYSQSQGLLLKPEKTQLGCFAKEKVYKQPDARFEEAKSLDHLGLSISSNLKINLPTEKMRSLRDLTKKFIQKTHSPMLSCRMTTQTQVRTLLEALKVFFTQEDIPRSYLDDLIHIVDDEETLKSWDLYVKQLVLKQVFGRFSKKTFRMLPPGYFFKKNYSYNYARNKRYKS